MPIGQAINFIGNTIQGAANRRASQKNTEMTIQANKEMAEYAYAQDLAQWERQNVYNLERWHEQNLYNSPAEQMKRYKEAGLNPNLIYGTGTTSAGNTGLPAKSESAKYNAPRQEYNYQPHQIGMALSQYQDSRMKSAQIDHTKEMVTTQQLENKLRMGSISSQLTKLKNEAKSSGSTAEVKRIEEMERKWSYANNIQIDKWAAELVKSQMEAKTARNRQAVTAWEKRLAKQGMSVSDPLWLRQGVDKGENIWEWLKKKTQGGGLFPIEVY